MILLYIQCCERYIFDLYNISKIILLFKKKIVLLDDQGEYLLNGHNVINTYKKTFPYAGVTFEYSGANSTVERVNTTYSRILKKDLKVEVNFPIQITFVSLNYSKLFLKFNPATITATRARQW